MPCEGRAKATNFRGTSKATVIYPRETSGFYGSVEAPSGENMWRIYDAGKRDFFGQRKFDTRVEAEREITRLTNRRRDVATNALRFRLAPVPVLTDGTSPRAVEWQQYYDDIVSG